MLADLSEFFGVAFRFFFENSWAKLIANELLLIRSIQESLPSRDVLLCERARAQQFRAGGSGGATDERVLLGLSIAPSKLIDDLNVAATRRFTATDGVLDNYMHAPGGAVAISGGGFGQQVIQALPISVEDQAYLRSVVATLDSIIDLDFRESPKA